MFLIESLKPGLCVLLSLTSIRFPTGDAAGVTALGVLYVWDGRVLMPSDGRLRGVVAAPVVPRGCCVLGLAPARTAAVWLSVWTAGVTGRPFTPALTAICSPSPSMLVHSAGSRLHHSCAILWISLCSQYTRLLSATLYPLYPQSLCLFFCLSVLSLPHFLRLLLLTFFLFVFPTSLSLPFNAHRNTNINSSSWELL